MKKFRKVLDGLTTSSPGSTIGSPSCGSASGTPTAAHTHREIDIQETLVSENFQISKVSTFVMSSSFSQALFFSNK